jgi:penicillin amidase
MARFFRQFLRFTALLVIALAFLSVVFVTWLRTSLPQINGALSLPGLGGPVEVIRDGNGVPHIFADQVNDAYFGLGFTHAQDRLWQMEMTRRVGAGRLSEIFGSRTLKIDRFIRMLGLYQAAQAQPRPLPSRTGAAHADEGGRTRPARRLCRRRKRLSA